LGAAVRKFNQLAVPGLGGVWFAKQLFLATLGVIVAERLRLTSRNVKTIEIANAIEALACWCAFRVNGWQRDARLRGVQKLAGKTDLTLAQLRQPRFYVTQPMRMATVEALVDLGFVHPGSQRFNSFRCTVSGHDLVEAATAGYRPHKRSVEDYLVQLATDGSPIVVTPPLRSALSPLDPLAETARNLIRSRLCEGAGLSKDAARRKNGLTWVSSIRPEAPANWKSRPQSIEADHWNDLDLGASFFEVRNSAIDVLNAIESSMAPLHARRITAIAASKVPAVEIKLAALKSAAQGFLEKKADPTEGKIATFFCRSCVEQDHARIIRNLTTRDNRILLLRGEEIVAGPAFVGKPQAADSDEDSPQGPGAENVGRVPVPQNISPRIQNLYLLQLDLRGELEGFLSPLPSEEAA
jgi:hypothetical protein